MKLPILSAPPPLSQTVNATTTVSRRNLNNLFNSPGVTHNGARDMYAVFGYPDELQWEDFFELYRRHGIATRLTRGIARSCWRDVPTIEIDEKPVMVEELNALIRKKLFRKLEQADTLNRIGRFSVMFVGIPDGNDPAMPLGRARGKDAINSVFFQAYSERGTEVVQWETDVASPRFGMPVVYQLNVIGVENERLRSDTTTRNVHWTRIVHLAEDALDNDLEGLSSLEPVYNFIIDLIKSEGGSSEAYWRNARRVLAFQVRKGYGNATPEQLTQLRTDIEEFTNGWRDGLHLGNVDVQQLETSHADPKETILGAFKLISGSTGIPMRILTGEGGGQTAGNEDKASYNQLIKDRQEMMCSDWLFQTLTITGNAGLHALLPLNAVVVWAENQALNEIDKSVVRKNNAQALAFASGAISPVTGGFDGVLSPEQVARDVLDLEPETITGDGLSDDNITDEDLDAVMTP